MALKLDSKRAGISKAPAPTQTRTIYQYLDDQQKYAEALRARLPRAEPSLGIPRQARAQPPKTSRPASGGRKQMQAQQIELGSQTARSSFGQDRIARSTAGGATNSKHGLSARIPMPRPSTVSGTRNAPNRLLRPPSGERSIPRRTTPNGFVDSSAYKTADNPGSSF
jgi:hypothetical protein